MQISSFFPASRREGLFTFTVSPLFSLKTFRNLSLVENQFFPTQYCALKLAMRRAVFRRESLWLVFVLYEKNVNEG